MFFNAWLLYHLGIRNGWHVSAHERLQQFCPISGVPALDICQKVATGKLVWPRPMPCYSCKDALLQYCRHKLTADAKRLAATNASYLQAFQRFCPRLLDMSNVSSFSVLAMKMIGKRKFGCCQESATYGRVTSELWAAGLATRLCRRKKKRCGWWLQKREMQRHTNTLLALRFRGIPFRRDEANFLSGFGRPGQRAASDIPHSATVPQLATQLRSLDVFSFRGC